MAAAGGEKQLFALLRSILRLHRERLPPPMRTMGDTYVLSEFRRHLRSKTSDAQWRVFASEWQRYAAMLGGTADQQAAFAAAQAQPAAADAAGAGAGCGCGSHSCGSGAAAAEEDAQQQQQQQQQGAAPDVASVTAAIASGSRGITEELLLHMTPDQRRQLIKLQQEALSVGAEMLGKEDAARQLRQAAAEAADAAAERQ